VGQGHELDVAVEPGASGAVIARAFGAAHRARYGFTLDRPVEVVAVRHRVSDPGATPAFTRRGAATWADTARVDDGGPCDAVVVGPAVIALPDATLAVPTGWMARALPIGGWLVVPA
jgi:5-oxoprolinase (ATP-hydrolysing)